MEIYYEPQNIHSRMRLEEALQLYLGEIKTITLKNGKNIEIISDNQQFRSKPQIINNYDKFQNVEEGNDEFVEETIKENYEQFDYQKMNPKLIEPLRGKSKGLKKNLRKTILKSIDGSEQEKEFKNGRLRNTKAEKSIHGLNNIIQFSESNLFLQCANCHKFFNSEEKEEDKTKTDKNEQKIQNNHQEVSPQFHPNANPKSPFPQPQQQHQNNIIPHSQKGHQQGAAFPNKNQPYPYQHQIKPSNQQQYPPNMNMGFPQRQSQNQGFYQQKPNYNVPQMNQNQYQQIPPHQKNAFNNKGHNNISGGFPFPNQQMQNQFRGNQVFRARKKEVEEYEMDNENEINHNDNYDTEENYYYPASAKKNQRVKKIFINYPNNHKNSEFKRNLSGTKKNVSSQREFGYNDNNLTEFMNTDENEYYEYPYYNENQMIPIERGKIVNNHKMINVKVNRNIPYYEQDDYQGNYQGYENYQDYKDYPDYD